MSISFPKISLPESKTELVSRRGFLSAGAATLAVSVAGCTSNRPLPRANLRRSRPNYSGVRDERLFGDSLREQNYAAIYERTTDNGFLVPAIPWQQMKPRYLRQIVPNRTGEGPGMLVVETSRHFLYYTLPGGEAVRYGVGLGREGFAWAGRGDVRRKARWPKWHPPDEMIEREPQLEKYRTTYDRENDLWLGGMDGGPRNPLGARALYIFQGDKDTLYRLHGSPEWKSIGRSVSSGCVRMLNQDAIDLYGRVPEGTRIVVR